MTGGRAHSASSLRQMQRTIRGRPADRAALPAKYLDQRRGQRQWLGHATRASGVVPVVVRTVHATTGAELARLGSELHDSWIDLPEQGSDQSTLRLRGVSALVNSH